MGDLVFDGRARTDMSRAHRAEPIRRTLDRSGRRHTEQVRELLNTWADRLPVAARRDLVPRLQSDDNYEFLGAFWELYLAEVLRRCGYGPEFHPAVDGSSHRPDFRAAAPDPFLLEGTLASPSTQERAARRRRDTLYDLLDRTPSDAFFVDVELKALGSRAPSARALRQAVDPWLAAIDPDALIATGGSLQVLDSHALRWQWEDWDVVLRPLPKSPSQRRDAGDPLVGMDSHGMEMVDTRATLRRALREKASAYGDPALPFVIGVLVLNELVDEEDVRQVLFGSEGIAMAVAAGQIADLKAIRHRDGFWSGTKASHTRVASVVTAMNLSPWKVGAIWPTTWQNPWARRPQSAELPFPVVQRDPSSGELVTWPAAEEPWEFFGLGPEWPD